MEQSPSWEANRSSPSQEILRIYWNPKADYRIHKIPPPIPVLSQISPVHAPPSHVLSNHFNIPDLRLDLPSVYFSQVSYQNSACTSYFPHACHMHCSSHSSWFDHPIIFGEEYRPLSSSLCSLLHSPVTLSFLGPNILLSTPFSNSLSLFFSFCERESFTPIQTIDKL